VTDNPPNWPPPSWSAQDPNDNYGPPPAERREVPGYPGHDLPSFPGQTWFPDDVAAADSHASWVSRPGTVVAASVLGYITGGMLIVAAFVLFLGASIVKSFDSITGGNNTGTAAELIVDSLLNFGVAGTLIGGAATFTSGRVVGRTLLTVGGGVCLAECVYWVFRAESNTIVWTVVFAALAIVMLALAWTKPTTEWLRVTMMPNSPRPSGGFYQS
jgi:hypothetical protein